MDQQSILEIVLGWRRLIVRVTIAAIVVSVAVSLIMPGWYEASATFLPPKEGASTGGLVQFFADFGMDFGSAGLVSSTPNSDLMIGILKSWRLREQIVSQFGLQEIYRSRTERHAARELADHMVVSTTPEGLIEIRVEDRDRERAAEMANALLDLLDRYNRESSTEQAVRTREYVEETLLSVRGRLEAAARELKEFQEEHGTIEIEAQTRATVETIAELEAERARIDIERGMLARFSSPDQVEVRRTEAELDEIDRQLAALGRAPAEGGASGSIVLLPLDMIPELELRLADLKREVMVQEKVYEFLSSQLEDARIQESRDLSSIRIIDRAAPPLERTRPRRKLIVILTTLLAFLGSIGLAIATEGFLEYAGSGGTSGTSADLSPLTRPLVRLKRWSGSPPTDSSPVRDS